MSESVLICPNSMDSIPADKVLQKTLLDLQKRFPIYHVCPKCLAALLCGSAIRKSVATILQVSDEVGMTLSFASTTVHEEVDDLVEGVLLLEHDEVLLAATRSFHLKFVYFFGHTQTGIRAFESPLDSH